MSCTIAHYCKIVNHRVLKDGQLLFDSPESTFQHFSDAAYRYLQINYPKYHKMDNLCKLGLLASDILLNTSNLKIIASAEKTGVILSNRSSSLDTDVKYSDMVKSGVASPAVFVYSLPNIVIGEICIRNGIKGENTFFISDRYDIPGQVNYINMLFENREIDACIGGWMELIGENYEAFLYLAVRSKPEQENKQQPHTVEIIKKIYLNK